jgi:hypothetical protein
VLKDLFLGKLSPRERHSPPAEEQTALTRRISYEEKYFTGNMSPEDGERLKGLSELYSELFSSEHVELFSCSFTMGALLMADILNTAKTMGIGDMPTDT